MQLQSILIVAGAVRARRLLGLLHRGAPIQCPATPSFSQGGGRRRRVRLDDTA
jgi:hypothetical protein